MDFITDLNVSINTLCSINRNTQVPENEIDRISSEAEYEDIFKNYILKNVPFILPLFHNDWKCFKEWVFNGKPNFEFLKQKFGNADVPVANCNMKYYNSQEKENMLLKDFLDYWRSYIDSNYSSDMKCLYLKDWHFTRDFPGENVYVVPKYFSSDWLNEYLTNKDGDGVIKDDYRFVYMGPKGTWTPFHSDVFSSFSWSANICGKKRWLMFPPGEEKHFKDEFGNLVYDIEAGDPPLFHSDAVKCYQLIQGPGEAVFVPSGWHHQVWNLDDTISINHNWINGCNIGTMWEALGQELAAVKREIEDCQTMDRWVDHCQVMLKASFGIDYLEFCQFMEFIANRRLNLIVNNEQLVVYGGWQLGSMHAVFDVAKIRSVLCDMISNGDVQSLESFRVKIQDIKVLVGKISSVLEINSCR